MAACHKTLEKKMQEKYFCVLELQNINDVEYLRKTLSVEKSEEEALQYFQVMALLLVLITEKILFWQDEFLSVYILVLGALGDNLIAPPTTLFHWPSFGLAQGPHMAMFGLFHLNGRKLIAFSSWFII